MIQRYAWVNKVGDESANVTYNRWLEEDFLLTIPDEKLKNRDLIKWISDPTKYWECLSMRFFHGDVDIYYNQQRMEEFTLNLGEELGLFVDLFNRQFGLNFSESGIKVLSGDLSGLLRVFKLDNRLEDLVRVVMLGNKITRAQIEAELRREQRS